MMTKQIKQAVAGALVCAMTLGVPGFPCYQALAQVSVVGAGGAAAVSGGVGAAGAVSIGVVGAQPLAPSGLVSGMASPVSLFAPAPSVIVPQASNGLTPAGPAAVAAKIPGAMALPLSVIPSRAARPDAPTTWSTLQRIGGFAAQVKADDAASAEAARGIGAAFDGRASANDLLAAPVAAKWSLLKAGTLGAAAAAVAAVPLPALAAPAAQAVSAASSLPMDTGSMVVLGLAAVGLGIFLYNVNLAVTGWRDMRRIERRHKAFIHALSVRDRHAARLKQETGAVHVAALETSSNQWELVVYHSYHSDRATLAAQKAMPDIEGLPVRAERLTPAAVVRLLTVRPEPAPAQFRSPLVKALLIGAAAAAALMLLTGAAVAAPIAAAVSPVLAVAGGGVTFAGVAFLAAFLLATIMQLSFLEALCIGFVAGFTNFFLALFVIFLILLSRK